MNILRFACMQKIKKINIYAINAHYEAFSIDLEKTHPKINENII